MFSKKIYAKQKELGVLGLSEEKRAKKLRIFKEKQNFKKGIRTLGITLVSIIIGVSYTFSYIGYTKLVNSWGDHEFEYTATFYANVAETKNETDVSVNIPYEGETARTDNVTVAVSPESGDSIEEIIRSVFNEDSEVAISVAMAESNMHTKAIHLNSNGSKDCGLFQINSINKPTVEQCTDARANAELAKKIWEQSGWGAWSSYNNGSYKKFVK